MRDLSEAYRDEDSACPAKLRYRRNKALYNVLTGVGCIELQELACFHACRYTVFRRFFPIRFRYRTEIIAEPVFLWRQLDL
jgi:hypothetical protein